MRKQSKKSSIIPSVELYFLGELNDNDKKEVANFKFPDSVKFLGSVCYERSLEQMQKASALLLVEAILKDGIFLPSKFCDYAVSAKPMLMFSPKNGTIADIVGKNHPGLLGQTEHEVTKGLELFFRRYTAGNKLQDYLCPDPGQFSERRIVDQFMARIRNVI